MIGRNQLAHAAAVFGAFTMLFAWLFARPILDGSYLSESDLYDIFLPIFLSPRTVWSPYEFAGMPTFADPENMEFYPLHMFFAAVGSWTGFIMSAYVLGACFMYAYVYRHTRCAVASALAGATYGLSEAMIERLPHPVIVHALAWLPLIVLALDGIRAERRRWLWVAVGAFAAANCVLAGHPQIPVYIAYVCAGYVVVGAIADRGGLRYLAAAGAMALLAALLTAVTLLPVIEAALLIQRQGVEFSEFVDYSKTVPGMLSMFFPTVEQVGRETPTYVGLAALALMPLGALQARTNWRAAFWLIVVLLALLLAVGSATPLARLVFALPLQQNFRIVARYLVFAAFGAAVLAGFGLAALRAGHLPGRRLVRSVAVLLLVMIGGGGVFIAWPEYFRFVRVNERLSLPLWNSGIWLQFGMAAAVALVCFGVSRRPRSAGWAAALVCIAAGDLVHAQPYRVNAAGLSFDTVPAVAVQPSIHTRRLAERLRDSGSRLLAPGGAHNNDVLPTVFARVWRISSAGGYTSMLLDDVGRLAMMSGTGRVALQTLADDDIALDLLAVRYIVLSQAELEDPEMRHVLQGQRWREVERFRTSRFTDRAAVDEERAGETDYVVLENRRALPRAWMVSETVGVSDDVMANAVRGGAVLPGGGSLDPARTALVPGTPDVRSYPSRGAAQVTSIAPGAIEIRVSSTRGGFVVLSEAYYPGWRVRVDEGAWRPVTPANLALQGVEVPPGEHLLHFEFSPLSRRVGAAFTAVGLLIIGGLLLFSVRGGRGAGADTRHVPQLA